MTTELNATALRALHEAATPGPWEADKIKGHADFTQIIARRDGAVACVSADINDADGELTAYLRNAVPDILALIEERDRLREEVERLRKAAAPEWFYLGDDCSSEQCRFGIHEVIDEDYFWDKCMEGDHVVEIATATSCPTIWAVVHCYTEAEKDELQTDDDYSVVEYATEAEARAALAGEQ